jgi:hypothetical protein
MAGQLFPTAGPPVLLSKPEMVIGRAPNCDIVLNASFVSSRHCVLTFDGKQWNVQDLGSTNGTETKNIVALDLTPLPPGSTLIIARRLRYVIEYDPDLEKARFSGGTEVIGDIDDYAEMGPATARLTGRHSPVHKKKES